jgi:DNA adenine methylase
MAKEVPTNKMKIKALAPYLGGKRNLAPRIVKLLGKHSIYWEPFCGSMAVLLAKNPCRMETVNDLYGDLINLARVIQNPESAWQLYDRLYRTLMHEQLFIEAAEKCRQRGYYAAIDGLDVDRAYDFFVASWLGRNGLTGCKSYNWTYCARYTPNGGHSGKRWRSVIESIPAWHKRLLGVTILQKDAFDIISRIHDSSNTAIYIDSPYIEKNAEYVHDFKPKDHVRLAALLHRFEKATVVVSLYDHPNIEQIYPDWFSCKVDVSKAIDHQNTRGANKTRATEILLSNRRMDSSQMLFL